LDCELNNFKKEETGQIFCSAIIHHDEYLLSTRR